MTPGKQFEADIKASMPKDVWYYRFKDSPATYDMNIQCSSCPKNQQKVTRFATRNICDCEVFKAPNLFLFELKSTKLSSIPFKNFEKDPFNEKAKSKDEIKEDSRIKQMRLAGLTDGIKAGFIVNFRESNETFYLPIEAYIRLKSVILNKSISIQWFRKSCFKIGQNKKKVHWKYEMDNLINELSDLPKIHQPSLFSKDE